MNTIIAPALTGENVFNQRDLDRVLKRAKELAAVGLDGVFAQYDSKVAAWGDLELVALD